MQQLTTTLQVISKNLELQTQESNAPVIGEESNLSLAVNGKRIAVTSLEPLKEVLRLIMVKIGLRSQNWPNEAEKAVLLDFILSEYGNHTHEELKLAFHMAITGKLDGVDGKCYENFSCAYIAEVMTAYHIWAKEAIKYIPKQPVKMIENKEDIDNDALWDATEALVKKGGRVYIIPDLLYDWMNKNGNILVTPEEKKEYWERACLGTHSELVIDFEGNSNNANRDILARFNKVRETKAWDSEPILKTRVQNLAKKMVIFKMMKSK